MDLQPGKGGSWKSLARLHPQLALRSLSICFRFVTIGSFRLTCELTGSNASPSTHHFISDAPDCEQDHVVNPTGDAHRSRRVPCCVHRCQVLPVIASVEAGFIPEPKGLRRWWQLVGRLSVDADIDPPVDMPRNARLGAQARRIQ